MPKTLRAELALCFLCGLLTAMRGQAQSPSAPRMSIRLLGNDSLRLAWTNIATGFVLEEAPALSNSALWKLVVPAPELGLDEYSLTIQATGRERFFRLRSAPLTQIRETSPANGETGVAVTRETIIRFSEPLWPTGTLSLANFYAEAVGRRLLARAELAGDHQTATLFYLEDLPASARVRVTLRGDGLFDALGRALDADGDGREAGTATVEFETLSITPVAGTAVTGRVFASELAPGAAGNAPAVNRPLPGVTITVDGAEETLRTVTDAMGNFKLEPCPAGRFFVHVDGRTSPDSQWPKGAYYPFVGKAWEALAGRTDNLAGGTGEIYLPLVAPATLQPVSPSQDTTITFPPEVLAANPALAGVSLTVPANSLFSDNGVRGGMVGIAPVPPDRLPERLPPGLEFPIVITVQTDGPANFDRPVPICFPNLPEPSTGQALPPGTQNWLYSFNHDVGRFEPVGPMTVSADGRRICTDSGVGILQPGWHGSGPPPFGPPVPPPGCAGGGGAGGPAVALNVVAPFSRRSWNSSSRADVESIFSRSANISLAGPSICLPPPCEIPDVEQCLRLCNQEFVRCKELARMRFGAQMEVCGTYFNLGLTRRARLCFRTMASRFTEWNTACADTFSICNANCFANCEQDPASRAALLAQAGGGDPIADEIIRLWEQALTLIQPYASTSEEIPVSIINQMIGLSESADAIAGGNAESYLRERVIELEREIYPLRQRLGFAPGDSPPYAVNYLAEIRRPSGLIELRNHTQPYGQYTLFVPRDGEILSISFYDSKRRAYGTVFPELTPEVRFTLPRFHLRSLDDNAVDLDRDGLPDLVESVYDSDPENPDTDGDGIPDGTEVDQGTNPLDGRPTITGIIASADTPGNAVDLCALNDVAVVADSERGVAVFNVFNGLNPVLVAQVDTPGTAQAVACSGSFIAVADGAAGLSIIDISDPARAVLRQQVNVGGTARAVAAAGGIAYVGTKEGSLVLVDLPSGALLDPLDLGLPVQDLGLEGNVLFALLNRDLNSLTIPTTLRAFGLGSGLLDLGSFTWNAFKPETITGRRRLFVGGGFAYVSGFPGYDTIDARDPAAMAKAGDARDTGPNSFKQIALNGSGLGIAAVGTNPRPDGTHDVYLYDVSNPAVTTAFLTTFLTPGTARAVALYNGLAYVADGERGLQVVNYRAYDSLGKPPTIALAASFGLSPASVEGGKLVTISAQVTDDVQVRNVEFYLGGARVANDGNFPFEYSFVTPTVAAQATSFRLRARAFDTGGNSTWTDEITVALTPDVSNPRVVRTSPLDATEVTTPVSSVTAFFSEAIDPVTLTAQAFRLFAAGPDRQLDTADDVPVGGGTILLPEILGIATRAFAGPLPQDQYRAVVGASVKDRAGNALVADFNWTFSVRDISPPQRLAVFPADDAQEPGPIPQIIAYFNEALDPATVTSATLKLIADGLDQRLGTPDDVPVTSGQISYNAELQAVVLSFSLPLLNDRYRATLQPPLADVQGNVFRSAYSWDFVVGDPTPPQVVSTLPDYEALVPDLQDVSAVFDEPLDPTTITDLAFQITSAGPDGQLNTPDDVPITGGTFGYEAAENRARVGFGAPLPANRYRAVVQAPLANRSGRPMESSRSWVFQSFLSANATTVRGLARLEDGTPATGATVTAALKGLSALPPSVISTPDGSFAVANVPSEFGSVSVEIQLASGGRNYFGSVAGLNPVAGQTTDAGTIILREICEAQFAEDLFPRLAGYHRALAVFDDGTGPALFAAGVAGLGITEAPYRVGKWDGRRWVQVGGGLTEDVNVFAVFNDGTGAALFAGGRFGLARFNGSRWTLLGAPASSRTVNAMAVFNDGSGPALFVAGDFTNIGGLSANRIAKWNGSQWSTVGTAVTGTRVNALTVFDDGSGAKLYAGGDFTAAGGLGVNDLARWDGAVWSQIGGTPSGGVASNVESLHVFNDGSGPALFVGGQLRMIGSVTVVNIARWNGTEWSSPGNGVNQPVRSMAVYNDGAGAALYAGVGLSPGVFKWNGTEWTALPGFNLDGAFSTTARSLVVFNDGNGEELYVGGEFGGGPDNGVLKWNGARWAILHGGIRGEISALTVFNDGAGSAIYAAATSLFAGGQSIEGVARWTGAQWSPVGPGLNSAFALIVFNDGSGPALYAGGINRAGRRGVFKWTGTDWAQLGPFTFAVISSLAVFDDGSGPALYAGGRELPGPGVIKWDGSTWSAVGRSFGLSIISERGVLALGVFDDGTGPALYAGGEFAVARGAPATGLAKWDGRSWSPVGPGLGSTIPESSLPPLVFSLTVYDDGTGPALYAGGSFGFDTPSGPVSNIARWDGRDWSPLGSGIERRIAVADTGPRALAVFDDGSGPALYAGGLFVKAGGIPVNGLARWDGLRWSALGNGVVRAQGTPGSVLAMAVFEDGRGLGLFIGGTFGDYNGSTAENLTKWYRPTPPCP
ncbi:MAG: Ig-like domain-containing protein [Verrucomicrobia bacterium]|nr:Ig-like domain-containing protein [Verrucomicrobiota bacterium]